MRIAQLLTLSLAVASIGCVSTNATVLDLTAVPRPPLPPDQVKIYLSADQVKARYVEIALLHSKGETNWTNENKMLASMRKKAASLGANGIILSSIDEPSAVAKVAAQALKTGTERKGRSVAVFVFPDTTRR